jgi:hypothetical protein
MAGLTLPSYLKGENENTPKPENKTEEPSA